MKKIFSLLAAAFLMGLTACEDVPAPYGINDSGINEGGNGGDNTGTLLEATFATTLRPFTNYTTSGSGAWRTEFSAATASGYDISSKTTTAGTYYLVSPEVEVPAEDTHVTFDYVLRYVRAVENQQFLITDNFDEANPSANWTLLKQDYTEGSDYTTFTSADVQIPEQYQGKKVRVAFRYSCTSASASTWEVKNFSWKKGKASDEGGDEPGTGSEKTLFSEDFSGGQGTFSFNDVSLGSGLSYVWKATSYNTSYYLIASAFVNGASHASESWAISPAINLADSKTATLNFSHAINKLNPSDRKTDMMTVWVSTDYNGSDVKAATWTQVQIPNYPEGNTNWDFVDAGDMDLTPFCGKEKVYIGLRYTSEDGISGSWEVRNFVVTGDGTPTQGGDNPGSGDNPGGGDDNPGTVTGDGTAANPYTVSDIFSVYVKGEQKAAVVTGYIVGYVEGMTFSSGCHFNLTDGGTVSGTNVLLAASATETDPSKCVPVQLPAGEVRTAINLAANPGNLGRAVTLTGSIEAYFGVAGFKTVTAYEFK